MAAPSSPSFIPKQPASGKLNKRSSRKIYILAYVSFVIFFGTLIATAGTFFFEVSVKSQLDAEKQKLVDLNESFNNADFVRLKELHHQLDSANKLMNQHASVVTLFEDLEKVTVSDILISELKLEREGLSQIVLTFSAVTDDFNALLFQREMYKNTKALSDADLVGLSSVLTYPFGPDVDVKEKVVSYQFSKSLSTSDIPYKSRSDGVTISNSSSTEDVIDTVDENFDLSAEDLSDENN